MSRKRLNAIGELFEIILKKNFKKIINFIEEFFEKSGILLIM
jgi:DNA-directed RNA polymerase beta subunit